MFTTLFILIPTFAIFVLIFYSALSIFFHFFEKTLVALFFFFFFNWLQYLFMQISLLGREASQAFHIVKYELCLLWPVSEFLFNQSKNTLESCKELSHKYYVGLLTLIK